MYLEASAGCDSSEAILLSPCLFIDSNITTSPIVEFAYHMDGNGMGKLQVDLITENGIIKNAIPKIEGDQGSSWQTAQINLQPYLGQNVIVRFRGKTGFGFRSDLSLDYFKVFDNSVTAPTSSFSVVNSGACTNDTITFQDNSTGTINNYQWSFGAGATPATANTAGPHKVVYSSGGAKLVSLTVSNAGGSDVTNNSAFVKGEPNTNFSSTVNLNTVNFNDASAFSPTAWHWDFGDGDTSNLQNPTHIYWATGTYAVSLTTTNNCGSATFVDSVTINAISLEEELLKQVQLFPNPTEGQLNLNLPDGLITKSALRITDLSGRLINKMESGSLKAHNHLNLSKLPKGVYLIELSTDAGQRNFRVLLR
ncbi:MAG: PKD domain-containing protein [Owenweeksia sp.]|nr:PKD domain-containing protein [Owenweeksia sp.]